jgi:tetrahydromethanopterin S-methyltransferase subunit E
MGIMDCDEVLLTFGRTLRQRFYGQDTGLANGHIVFLDGYRPFVGQVSDTISSLVNERHRDVVAGL